MERGVVIGGTLIAASFLLAVMLNRSAMEAAPAPSVSAQLNGSGPAVSMPAADAPASAVQPAVRDNPGAYAGSSDTSAVPTDRIENPGTIEDRLRATPRPACVAIAKDTAATKACRSRTRTR